VQNLPKSARGKSKFGQLQAATKDTKTKGEYSKGDHSFKIMERIVPQKVIDKSGWAKRFLHTVLAKTNEE
jgi:hypothetical protein